MDVTPLRCSYGGIRLPLLRRVSFPLTGCSTLPLGERRPADLPSSRLCRGDVLRSWTPVGSPASWPWTLLISPSLLLTRSAPTVCTLRGSIPSRLRIAAHHLPVYASSTSLPSPTQHSVLGASPRLPRPGSAPG